jgi:UPF0755 protein
MFGLYQVFQITSQPHSPRLAASNQVILEIQPGEGFKTVSQKLLQNDLIQNEFIFYWFARLQKMDKKIKPGLYEFSNTLNFNQVLSKLIEGDIKKVTFGFQEGWNHFQIYEKLKKVFPKISKSEWTSAVQNTTFLKLNTSQPMNFNKNPTHQHLEGFLFPNTYNLPATANADTIVKVMTNQFSAVFTQDIISKGAQLKLTPYEIVILASIIEKETGQANERTRISAVFHNRLKLGMRLQTDPTIIYGIWSRYDGNIRKKDLLEPNPYNTYLNSGMPPTPIANPGKDSIFAAVNPIPTKDLYFVGKGDGTHYFSETLAQHNRAVYQYQIKR